jgi:hypothetical protein
VERFGKPYASKDSLGIEDKVMTCYLRHLQEIFNDAGIEVTKDKKQELDKIIHEIARTKYKNCPVTWKEVKKRIAEDARAQAQTPISWASLSLLSSGHRNRQFRTRAHIHTVRRR